MIAALGPLLLQPQSLDRLQALDEAQAFGDDLLALLQQLLVNPDHAESVAPAFHRAFDQMGDRLRGRLEPRLQKALDELGRLLEPATQAAAEVVRKGKELESVAEVVDLLTTVLDRAVAAVDALSEAQLRDLARRLRSLVADTLGLDQPFLQGELRQVFRTARAELLAGVGALEPRAAGIHLSLAALLGRLEGEFADQWPALDLDADRLAQLLIEALKGTGFERIRAQVACLGERLRAVVAAGGAVVQLAAPSSLGPGSLGAGRPQPPLSGDKYCWYASWLYANRRSDWTTYMPGMPGDEVWVSADGKQLILRRAFADDQVLYEAAGGGVKWSDAPQFMSASGPECYTFGLAGPEFMEVWTQLFATLAEFAKAVTHIVFCATSPKEKAANIPLSLWDLSKSVCQVAGEAPLPSVLTKCAGWGLGTQWMYILVPWLSVTLGSLEGKHTKTTGANKFLQWLTLLGGDALSAFQIHTYATGAHDALLSLLTLLNYKGPAGAPEGQDTRPLNREQGGALTGLAVAGANWLLMKLIPRHDYAYPFFGGNPKFYLYWLLCAPLMGAGGGLVGTLGVWALSRTYDWGQLGKEIGKGALKAFLMFIVQEYTTKEGDTDDGKYNPTLDPDGNTYSPARAEFRGYPPKETSPYLLPYEKGTAMYVGQANQGMFSHMRFNWLPQIYAYDFAHDFGDEILAARGGTVVDYFDWIPDNINPDNAQVLAAVAAAGANLVAGQSGSVGTSGPSWNFIMIRHDTYVAEHDRDVGGNPVVTFGVYGHGKTGGVRESFQARGVAPTAIIGTVVQQGQVIMKAGCTGMSFHNHLHMHVLGWKTVPPPATPPTTPAPTPAPPITSAQLTDWTLPFVFREAGVLKNLTWYESDNERAS